MFGPCEAAWPRLFRVCLALLLSLLALAGCGGGGGGGDDAAQDAPAIIDAQPLSQAAVAGGSVTLSVSARGTALSYQWQRSLDAGASWTDIVGATAASYTQSGLTSSMNGWQFRVAIRSGSSTVLSSPVTLSVTPPTAPAIAVQPADVHVLAGANANFSVTATGTALAYQWQRSADGGATWGDVAGGSAATLALNALATTDSGSRFRVVVSNAVGSVTSSAALLTVDPVVASPTITSQPSSVSVTAPASATFTVVAAGSPAPGCQWQRSTDSGSTWLDIPGATACSYTTPATGNADNGTRLRAIVSNSAGRVTSASATLNVAAAPVAATITTQPQSQTVNAPATATFTAAATGTPTPSWQWQLSTDGGLSFSNITGATAASYTTPATSAADNGKRFRVVASNSAGSSTSSAAVLTVNAADASPLAGRSWRTGQLMVAGAPGALPQLSASVIDDVGRITLVYQQNSGGASTLYALRATPNAAATAPSLSTPVKLGPVAGATLGGISTRAVVTPGGDVGVLWTQFAPCGPTDYQTTSDCVTAYVSRYRASSDSWDAPVPVQGLVPVAASTLGVRLWLDDQGDILVSGSGWVRSGTTSYTAKGAIFMRTAGETSFRQQLIEDAKASGRLLAMDNQGRILMGATYSQNATTDVVVYRGDISAGLQATPVVLDSRASPAQVRMVEAGANGQQIVLWSQNNGVRDTWYSAIAASPADTFSTSDMGIALGSTQLGSAPLMRLFVSDAGDVLVYDQIAQLRIRWTAATGWGLAQTIPGLGQYSYRAGFNRRGDYVRLDTADVGNTMAYDGARNLQLPSPGYVLGTATQASLSNPNFYLYPFAYADPLVSLNGMAFQSIIWSFDVLPTPALPAGDGRNAVSNLWGVYLK